MSEATKDAAERAAAAVTAVDLALAKASRAESEALASLLGVRKRRSDVGVSIVDGSVSIALLAELESAEAHHDACSKRSRDLYDLRTDLVRAHERAAREHHAAEQREAAPAARDAHAELLNSFELYVREHAHVVDLLRSAGQPVTGDGFTSKFADILRRYGLRPDLGSLRH